MTALLAGLRQLRQYPSAIIGMTMVLLLLGLSLVTVLTIPYSEAIRLWRGAAGVWDESPELARPTWFQLFSARKLPKTIIVDTRQGGKAIADQPDGTRMVNASLRFAFPYDELPSAVGLWLSATYKEAQPFVILTWRKPNGEEIAFEERTPGQTDRYFVSRDERLRERLQARSIEEALFGAGPRGNGALLRGTYELAIEGILFEPDADLEARLVVYGKVHGIAGTDAQRRDLSVALLWGTPIALTFGLLAAVGTTIFSLMISAMGTWFGGRLDASIQRLTEVNAMLPGLTLLVMIGMFYSRSLWVMLLAIILLSMFSLGIKTYRAIFLSLKEAPYIEAARTYGAGSFRIIFRYMIPRVIPMLIPAFVTAIPGFVFLEASLSILGLGDPDIPTWGKLLFDAYANEALFKGYYYWVLEPAALLMITGMSFAMSGFALDRMFNPRLRTA
jgi:peptide/nickel transport system permease protein